MTTTYAPQPGDVHVLPHDICITTPHGDWGLSFEDAHSLVLDLLGGLDLIANRPHCADCEAHQ